MPGHARFGHITCGAPVEIRHDAAALDEPGFWVVVITFEGELTAVRMRDVQRGAQAVEASSSAVRGTAEAAWRSSLSEQQYETAVEQVRARIARGEVYQVNVCRVLEREVPEAFEIGWLASVLAAGNPAPYAALIDIPDASLEIACASPELYLSRHADELASAPIKGTAVTADEMLPKDFTENVMITDLVRNDLSRVCLPGTVAVDGLCAVEQHPGLVHLVSKVVGTTRSDVGWQQILDATFPPGSVSGAPKSTALQAIRDLERAPRGPYCGAIGYVDNASGEAVLAVGIRTFWIERSGDGRRLLKFGTGAGITWGSDAQDEWCETLLKADRLTGLAQIAIDEGTS